MNTLKDYIIQISKAAPNRIIVSKPASKSVNYKKVEISRQKSGYQIARYTDKQVFHENIKADRLSDSLETILNDGFLQLNAWSDADEHMLMISKKGSCSYKKRKLKSEEKVAVSDSHNRKKNYLIEEGSDCPPLVDMGIFTKEGRVVASKYDKFKQINRFIEIIDDEVSKQNLKHLTIIDFGCGKSYLTFVIYYYLVEIKGIEADITGLDLKADVIKKCNEAAKKYGYDGLHFELGDINGYKTNKPVDMVVTLHACDTATDYALFNAINWKAKMIFSVPCCQHELNAQISTEGFSALTRYGIIKERFSALATDAIRANLLSYCGYSTQLLEFIDFEHTPKNILIRAVYKPVMPKGVKEKALTEVKALMNEFNFEPTLYKLLKLPELKDLED
ncbi:MAG: SAM-dependent methyltransferase [Pseudobutyrivibrio sp.]|nr:SAM-dependent methyltransferase [Pseudobutyrivibrio sp.]